MDGKLLLKVRQRKERVKRIKEFLVFPMAALHFAIMPGRVRANELMADAQVGSGFLKKGLDVPFAVGKTISKFKTVISLDTFHMDTLAGIPLHQPFQEISGGIGGLLRISRQETKPGELVNGGIWNRRSSGSAIQRRGTTFTSTCTLSPGWVICW